MGKIARCNRHQIPKEFTACRVDACLIRGHHKHCKSTDCTGFIKGVK